MPASTSVTITQQVSIAGQVKDTVTGKVISGALIELINMPQELQNKIDLLIELYGEDWEKRPDKTHANVEGMFYFTDLPDGHGYTIQASLPLAGTRYFSSVSSEAVTVSGAVELGTDFIEIGLSPTAVAGTITNVNGGEAIPMAKVQVQGSGETTFSAIPVNEMDC